MIRELFIIKLLYFMWYERCDIFPHHYFAIYIARDFLALSKYQPVTSNPSSIAFTTNVTQNRNWDFPVCSIHLEPCQPHPYQAKVLKYVLLERSCVKVLQIKLPPFVILPWHVPGTCFHSITMKVKGIRQLSAPQNHIGFFHRYELEMHFEVQVMMSTMIPMTSQPQIG